MYANKLIDEKSLHQTNIAGNIIFNKNLYKYNSSDIEFIIKTFKFLDPINKNAISSHLYNEEELEEYNVITHNNTKNGYTLNIDYSQLRLFIIFKIQDPTKTTNYANVINYADINSVEDIKNILNVLEKDTSGTGLSLEERKYDKQGTIINRSTSKTKSIILNNQEKLDFNKISKDLNIKWEDIPKFASYLMDVYNGSKTTV